MIAFLIYTYVVGFVASACIGTLLASRHCEWEAVAVSALWPVYFLAVIAFIVLAAFLNVKDFLDACLGMEAE